MSKIEWWIKEAEQNKERLRINKDCLRDLWENIKHTHIQTEEDQKKKKQYWGNIWGGSILNVPNIWKEIAILVQEALRVPYRINPRINMTRHILIKLMKFKHKEQILNAPREKQQVAYKGIPLRLMAHLSIETARQRRIAWYAQVMKGETLQPTLCYQARISFLFEGEIKSLQTSKS